VKYAGDLVPPDLSDLIWKCGFGDVENEEKEKKQP
jgi:hypothetical protein